MILEAIAAEPTIGAAATNPEAIINAAIAANAAAAAAYQAFVVSMIILGAVLLIGAMMGMVALKFNELEANTNSMKDALVDATRKLALIEGKVLGKAEEKLESAERQELKDARSS